MSSFKCLSNASMIQLRPQNENISEL